MSSKELDIDMCSKPLFSASVSGSSLESKKFQLPRYVESSVLQNCGKISYKKFTCAQVFVYKGPVKLG